MEYNPFLRKNIKTKKENLNGALLVSVDNAIVEIAFKYGQSKIRSYTNNFANGIAINFVGVNEQIYTSRIDLPFAHNGKMRMQDGAVMNIESLDKVLNENTGKVTGLYINLNGGGK